MPDNQQPPRKRFKIPTLKELDQSTDSSRPQQESPQEQEVPPSKVRRFGMRMGRGVGQNKKVVKAPPPTAEQGRETRSSEGEEDPDKSKTQEPPSGSRIRKVKPLPKRKKEDRSLVRDARPKKLTPEEQARKKASENAMKYGHELGPFSQQLTSNGKAFAAKCQKCGRTILGVVNKVFKAWTVSVSGNAKNTTCPRKEDGQDNKPAAMPQPAVEQVNEPEGSAGSRIHSIKLPSKDRQEDIPPVPVPDTPPRKKMSLEEEARELARANALEYHHEMGDFVEQVAFSPPDKQFNAVCRQCDLTIIAVVQYVFKAGVPLVGGNAKDTTCPKSMEGQTKRPVEAPQPTPVHSIKLPSRVTEREEKKAIPARIPKKTLEEQACDEARDHAQEWCHEIGEFVEQHRPDRDKEFRAKCRKCGLMIIAEVRFDYKAGHILVMGSAKGVCCKGRR